MPNGQTGLPLTAPPGGGAPFVSTGKKGGIDLDQVLPLLLLVSPLLELRSPGSGMGLAAGIVGYQKEKQEKRRRDSMGLLQMLSEIDDDQIETAIGALADAGYDPQLVKAMAKASRGMVDPGRKAERALNQLVEDPSLGLIPRRTQIDVQARQQAEGQAAGREDVRFQRQEAAESQRFERGQVAGLAGEARSLLISLSMNPALSPQARVQISQLAQRLAAGEDPQGIIAEASALAGEVGQAGAAQDLQQRQGAFRQRRLGELEAAVESGVPAAAGRIRALAKEQGLDPAPYLQRLTRNIRIADLEERRIRAQLAAATAVPAKTLSDQDRAILTEYGRLHSNRSTLMARAMQVQNALRDPRTLPSEKPALEQELQSVQPEVQRLTQQINQLEPRYNSILGIAYSKNPQNPLPPDAAKYVGDAAAQGVPMAEVLSWANQNGLDIPSVRALYEASKPTAKPPSARDTPRGETRGARMVDFAQRIRRAAQAGEPFPEPYLRQQGLTQQQIEVLRNIYNRSKPKKK